MKTLLCVFAAICALGAVADEAARRAQLEKEIADLRATYRREKRSLGYADEFGVYHLTPEGKRVDALERQLRKLVNAADPLAAARAKGWGTVPLGPARRLTVPKTFAQKAPLGPRAAFRPGLRLFGAGEKACLVCRPGDTNRLALAREFAYHLSEMTGAAFPVQSEFPDDHRPVVLFGDAADAQAMGVDWPRLPDETAVVRRKGRRLFVGGTGAGASHALTYVLEAMGCRYLWPGKLGKVIPRRTSVLLPEIDLVHTASLQMRAVRAPVDLDERHGGCLRKLGFDPLAFARRQRQLHCDRVGNRDFWRWHGVNDGKGTPGQKKGPGKYKWGHYFKDYIERYYDRHPEWFALQPDGTRTQCEKERPTFCLTNEALIEETIRNLVNDFKANPDAVALSACLPDGGHSSPCFCENCRRLDPPDASPRAYRLFAPEPATLPYVHMTDRVFWFMNRLADGVAARLPGKKLTTYAYSYYTDPPLVHPPSPNLVVLSVAGDYVNAYPRKDGGDSRTYAYENMAAWSSFGNALLWRPNCIRGFNCVIPQNCSRRIFNDLETFKANGLIGTDFDTLDEQWAIKGLTFYMTAKGHHNLDRLDYDTLLDDYCAAFGAAKDEMKTYFRTLEQVTEAAADKRCGILGYIDFFDPAPFEAILARAEKAAQDDALALRRVRFVGKGLAFARFVKRNKAASDANDPQLMRQLEAYRDFMHEQYWDDDAFIAVNVRRIGFYDHILRPLLNRDAARAAKNRVTTDLSGAGWTLDGAPVTVPHTWNALDGADGRGPAWHNSASARSYARRRGVYARDLPPAQPGRRYFIRCAGASQKAVVRVNGREIGRHVGGWTAFACEATQWMKPRDNRLEIEVDNFVDADVAPVHADFTVFGGLHRGVELIETGRVCIDCVTDGASGVRLEPNPATGEVVAYVSVDGGTNEIQRFRFPLADLQLWTPEKPKRYALSVTIEQEGCVDTVTQAFGFRTAEFRPDGFYLNGVRRQIRGVNLHQDHEGAGSAVSDRQRQGDIEEIKAMGATGLRTAHYPHAEATYTACDRQGLLVWCEFPNVNDMGVTETYRRQALQGLREMIAQLRHHPSIIAWSVANEYRTNSIVSHAYLKRFIGDLVGEARRLDPSRAVAAATCRSYLSEVNSLPDVLGFNFYPGWYRRTADEMRQTIDAALAETPRRTIAVTEYGAGGNTTCHEMAPVRNKPLCAFHSEEYQAWVHHGNYLSLAFDPRVWGTFSWLMYDFGADARREGARFGLNDKGLVTYDRQTRKDAFYFYQVNWQARERLYLVGQRLSATTNATGCVMAFWNGSGPVSLTVNGRDFPPRTPDPVRTVIWEDVPLKPGKNVISVSAGPFVEQAVWRLDS